MKTIVIANQKGGVGKTTTAITLAHGLARHERRVLLVDCDPQGQVATFLGKSQESGLFDLLVGGRSLDEVMRPAAIPGYPRPHLFLVPGDKRTATAQIVLSAEGFRIQALTEALSPLAEQSQMDFVVIDTSPSIGLLQEAAIYAADWLIVPCAADYPSVEGVAGVLHTMKAVGARGGGCLLLGVLPTMYDEITRESQATLHQLRQELDQAVLYPIHRATLLRDCAALGITVWEKSSTSRTAVEYEVLVEEILEYEHR